MRGASASGSARSRSGTAHADEQAASRSRREHEVVALPQDRDRVLLEGRGTLDALRRERLDQLGRDVELLERLHVASQVGWPGPRPPRSPGSYGSMFRKRWIS
jgi:hypothetical protein